MKRSTKEVGVAIVPRLIDKLYADDPVMQQRLHSRHDT
jgi:hypothetical protein